MTVTLGHPRVVLPTLLTAVPDGTDMTSPDRERLLAVEAVLAVTVLAITVALLADLRGFPSWPTVRGVPVNPELVVPGLLGLVVVLEAVMDRESVPVIALGILGFGTLANAVTGLYTLYTADGGGVFFGGLFTLLVGVPLAVVILGRTVLGRVDLG